MIASDPFGLCIHCCLESYLGLPSSQASPRLAKDPFLAIFLNGALQLLKHCVNLPLDIIALEIDVRESHAGGCLWLWLQLLWVCVSVVMHTLAVEAMAEKAFISW